MNKNLNRLQSKRDGDIPNWDRPQSPGSAPRLTTLASRSRIMALRAISKQTIDLGTARTANSPLVVPIRANVLLVNFTTFPTDQAQIRLNQAGDFFTVGQGWAVYGFDIELVELINVAQPGSRMELLHTIDSPDARVLFRFS